MILLFDQILAMMPQLAGYFRAQVSLCEHNAGALVGNHNYSNLNWDFSACKGLSLQWWNWIESFCAFHKIGLARDINQIKSLPFVA